MHQDKLGKAWAISEADIDESFAFIREIGANTSPGPLSAFRLHAQQLTSWVWLCGPNYPWSTQPSVTKLVDPRPPDSRQMRASN